MCVRVYEQLGVAKAGDLTMHMLVLFASTGASMDLNFHGYIIDRMKGMFPTTVYTPCIEEHNVHAIFRWDCFMDIYKAYRENEKDSINRIDYTLEGPIQDPSTLLFSMPAISLPVGLREQKFLNNTGLTMSITTLGTCIYRVGTKRVNLEAGDIRARATDDQAPADTTASEYSDLTEQFIFDMCRYIQLVLVS